MGRRRDEHLLYRRPTTQLLIDTIGRSRMTGKQIAALTGCDYQQVASKLASMHRLDFLTRDIMSRPYTYQVAEKHRDKINEAGSMIGLSASEDAAKREEIEELLRQRLEIDRKLAKLGVVLSG